MPQPSEFETSDPRLYRPHVARNREPILEVLRRILPPRGFVPKLPAAPASTRLILPTR